MGTRSLPYMATVTSNLYAPKASAAIASTMPGLLLLANPELASAFLILRQNFSRLALALLPEISDAADDTATDLEDEESSVEDEDRNEAATEGEVDDAGQWAERDDEDWERAAAFAREQGNISVELGLLLSSI